MNRSLVALCSFAVAGSAILLAQSAPKPVAGIKPIAKPHFRRDGTHSPFPPAGSANGGNGARAYSAAAPGAKADAVTAVVSSYPFARPAGSVQIRVYFHVILNKAGQGQVSDAQIAQQIDILNMGFAGTKTLPDGSQPRGGSQATPFKFVLAGIDRSYDDTWFVMQTDSPEEAQAKRSLYRGTSRDLNLYSCEPVDGGFSPVLGFSTYPWEYNRNRTNDGVVLDHRSMLGDPQGDQAAPDNQGVTAIREVGHWLGLLDTFYPAPAIISNVLGGGGCTLQNDQVADTPAEERPFSGNWYDPSTPGGPRPAIRDTCTGRNFPGADPVENFMDLTDDPYMYRFTKGQTVRMDLFAVTYRYL